MAVLAFAAFVIAGVFAVFSIFYTLVTWPRRKELENRPVKLASIAFAASLGFLLLFLIMADPMEGPEQLVSEDMPDHIEEPTEEIEWLVQEELGVTTSEGHEVLQDLEVRTDDYGEQHVHLLLTASDNVTTDLIKSSTMTTSARLLAQFQSLNEFDAYTLEWEFFVEPDQGETYYDELFTLTMTEETLASIDWDVVEPERLADKADAYTQHEELEANNE
ncbi:hypothetical protein [Salsuginibacillus kocurii]|uniref:hypothetical protein n=1 Tax=Salsuginibacillus kocurii TaxID=427078 RepID=UPI0003826706|nr:hypothetical protein [Salsuginibacillus kocurii]